MNKISRIGLFLPSLGMADGLEAFEAAVKIGFHSFQVWCLDKNVGHEIKAGQSIETVRLARREMGITVSAMSGYMDFTEDDWSGKIGHFQQQIDLAVEFGTRIVCTETGRKFKSRDEDEPWRRLAGAMRAICGYAEQKQVFVAVEMGVSDLVASPEAFFKLRDLVGSPQLKINYDPANVVRAGGDPIKWLEQLKDFVVHAHIKDASRERQMPLGQGAVPFREFFDVFGKMGYEGYFAIEKEYRSDMPPKACLEKDKRFIDETLESL